MKELKKRIMHLEHEQKTAIQALRDLDKGQNREEQLQHIEKLAHLEAIESELADKRLTLGRARLIPSKRERLKVAIGSVVDLIDQQGRLFRYTIVDTIEANPSDGRISVESPLGSTLLGKTLQDTVQLTLGAKQRQLQLVSIH
jgi:transcription elongation factor GreA